MTKPLGKHNDSFTESNKEQGRVGDVSPNLDTSDWIKTCNVNTGLLKAYITQHYWHCNYCAAPLMPLAFALGSHLMQSCAAMLSFGWQRTYGPLLLLPLGHFYVPVNPHLPITQLSTPPSNPSIYTAACVLSLIRLQFCINQRTDNIRFIRGVLYLCLCRVVNLSVACVVTCLSTEHV